jgi:hypothetical protein
MQPLALQRCFNHAQREAAARCLECGQFFCRECVSEHDDRVICASCLAKVARTPLTRRRGFVGALRFAQCLMGIMTLWFFYYLVGEGLLAIPASFHEGAVWRANWLDTE